jgi:hypothetical protein
VEAVALYHQPASATSLEFSALTVVHIANVLAQEDEGRVNGLPLPKLDSDYLATLGLPKKIEAWRKLLASTPANEPAVEKHAAKRAPSSSPVQRDGSKAGSRLLVVAGIAAVILTAAVLMRKPVHLGQVADSATNTDASSTSEATAGTNAPTAASPFDAIKVQGIMYSAAHPVVVINSKVLKVGERINGLEIVSIDRASVVISCKGEQKTFRVQ